VAVVCIYFEGFFLPIMENQWQKNMASLKKSTKMDALLPKCIISC